MRCSNEEQMVVTIGGHQLIAPRSAMEIIAGLALSFYGGCFMTTIAAVEAINAAGLDNVIVGMKDLLCIASSEQPFVEGGEAPKRVYTVFLAGVATLRSHLARAIVFGCNLGEVTAQRLQPRARPLLERMLPKEYHQRIPEGLRALCKLLGMALAWCFQRHMCAVQSALTGSRLLEKGLSRYAALRSPEQLRLVRLSVIGCGLAYQIRRGFHPPGLLLGLSVVEATLSQALTAL
mmetsp:Transcript_18033/g.32032  ORF Transcript_18033/g.32032 Transcript_18033/m.32032 type:complete len:234 (-) Transcript_18033:200-901(-)